MSTITDKKKMGLAIVNFEARRDKQGRISVYKLPSGDGGGEYEVAGINQRYHPAKAATLRYLIMAGQYDQAEREAGTYIIEYTDAVENWLGGRAPGAEFYLRDTYFNAGPGGAARVLQMALATEINGKIVPSVDGKVGKETKSILENFLRVKGDIALLEAVHAARWQYMAGKSKNPGKAQFWKGWQNRMNNALGIAKKF